MDKVPQLLVFTRSAKPVLCMHMGEDEPQVITSVGMIMSVLSLVENIASDELAVVKAGDRTMSFLQRGGLHLLSVDDADDPELMVLRRLDFAYRQIIMVLTSKVEEMLVNRPGMDVRDLLGKDSMRFICNSFLQKSVARCVEFGALRSYGVNKPLRTDVLLKLQECVSNSGAAIGLLLEHDAIIAYVGNDDIGLELSMDDLQLLVTFVTQSTSLMSHEQNWVPICYPKFNSKAYLQTYVAHFQPRWGHRESLELQRKRMIEEKSELSSDPSSILVLIAPQDSLFGNLHEAREIFEEYYKNVYPTLQVSHSQLNKEIESFMSRVGASHFFFKCDMLGSALGGSSSTRGSNSSSNSLQMCLWSGSPGGIEVEQTESEIWSVYKKQSLCTRFGTASTESTLFGSAEVGQHSHPSTYSSSPVASSALPAGRRRSIGSSAARSDSHRLSLSPMQGGTPTSSQAPTPTHSPGPPSSSLAESHPFSSESLSPTKAISDHSLIFSELSTGENVVTLTTAGSELHATFPNIRTPTEACSSAYNLQKFLCNENLETLFQLSH
jgi:hypothetical protein